MTGGYFTDWDKIHTLIGWLVEVDFVYGKQLDPAEYYTIQEAYETGLAKLSETQERYRGRLGVLYDGIKPKPVYYLQSPPCYYNGVQTERYTQYMRIHDEANLIAARMLVIEEAAQ